MKCHYCDKTSDLRPYGPKGAMVCFSCAMGTAGTDADHKINGRIVRYAPRTP